MPAIVHYLGHLVAHLSMRLYVEQDIYQAVTIDLGSYEDPPLTEWERSELVCTTLLPRWSYKWLLVLNDTTMYAINKKDQHFVTSRPCMCPKRDVGKVVTTKSMGGMGPH